MDSRESGRPFNFPVGVAEFRVARTLLSAKRHAANTTPSEIAVDGNNFNATARAADKSVRATLQLVEIVKFTVMRA
jgi:hypothetical protein